MISRLLIANRGEIAVRVARAAHEMGIAALGVFSEADAEAYHLRFMDDARCIGPAPAAQSYLNVASVVAAMREMHADAVHPGYGFLSENAAFARAVTQAGAIFVGPSPDAIAAAGSKIAAKQCARDAGVPTVPGYDGGDQNPQRLREEARRIGFPVLVKASAGGGGRGIRVVSAESEFEEALASAKREATLAFGDDTILLERYLRDPRHIEFQVLGDEHGTVLALGERECSIQRRHQKIVEEAPSVALDLNLRARMGADAVAVAKSIGYTNAGTVEFMLDRDGYYFLEMNARLQVEHPVTEMVYGVDLVRWQIRIASGERLSISEADRVPKGWAIEMRVTAEDPAHGMLPSSGTITRWQPPEGPGVRVDAGVARASVVGLDYDSLLAKLIVHDSDRPAAIARMERALAAFGIGGLQTNLPLLRWIANDEVFQSGALSTSFLQQRLDESQFAPQPATSQAIVLGVASLLLDDAVPWRIGGVGAPIAFATSSGRTTVWTSTTGTHGVWHLTGAIAGRMHAARDGERIDAEFGDERIAGIVERAQGALRVRTGNRTYALPFAQPPRHSEGTEGGAKENGAIAAPMPGRIVRVAIAAGEKVAPHQLLVVLEAMKMEHRIEASLEGMVKAVLVREGETVSGGAPLVELG